MDAGELKKFLDGIGFQQPPMNEVEIQVYTATVIACLPEGETYEFIVHADRSKHIPAKTTSEMSWEEKEAARIDSVNKSNQQLKQFMQEIRVADSGIEDGYFDFAASLTRGQAIALQESDLIEGLSAKHPKWIIMI